MGWLFRQASPDTQCHVYNWGGGGGGGGVGSPVHPSCRLVAMPMVHTYTCRKHPNGAFMIHAAP